MTDFNAIDDDELVPDAPGTSLLMFRLRDNPVAIAEGAANAPRIALAAMDAWFLTAGAPGTYVFARRISGDVAFGGTVAGSSLRPTSAAYSVMATGGSATPAFTDGGALSGTWQCMGSFDEVVSGSDESGTTHLRGATLWLRIM